MKKQVMLLLIVLVSTLCLTAYAVDDGGDPLTMEELMDWAAQIHDLAFATSPENDPHDAEALTEDGYTYVYPFGLLYFDSPDLSESSVLNTFVIYDEEMSALRGTHVDQRIDDLFPRYYTENSDLNGSSEQAVLYCTADLPAGAAWGWIHRDGQRIGSVQYSICEQIPGSESYRNAGIIYTVQEGFVSAIRAYGLSAVQDADAVQEEVAAVQAAAALSGYRAVPSSENGADLSELTAEEFTVNGIPLAAVSPEDLILALGTPEVDELIEDDAGYIRILGFGCNSFVYLSDPQQEQYHLETMELLDPTTEGPRAVRIGDSLYSVLTRFRFGEIDTSAPECPLYGKDGVPPFGVCSFGDDASAVVRYGFVMDDGRTGVLSLQFELLELASILFYIN